MFAVKTRSAHTQQLSKPHNQQPMKDPQVWLSAMY